MSRKDFVLIARTIANLDIDADTKRTVADAFASNLADTNSRFDAKRFLLAANAKA